MSVIKSAIQYPEFITHLIGANNYCWIYFQSGEKKLIAKPICYLEDLLPQFVRTHKSVLINPTYVRSLHQPARQKMAGEIQLENDLIFPVSRRRWSLVAEALAYRLAPVTRRAGSQVDIPAEPHQVASLAEAPELSVLLVTDDEPNALLVAQMMEKKWPLYQFHSTHQGNHIPDLFSEVPMEEYPVLLLLDARTTTLDRLHMLQRLKQHPSLRRLPIVLFVSPVDSLVTDGYKRQANSVISLQDGYVPFAQTIERVCQFWLQTAVLPSKGRLEARLAS